MAAAQYGMKWQLAGALASFGIGAAVFGPVLLPKYTKRFYQYYSASENQEGPIEVNDYTLGLVNTVLERLKLPEEKASKLDFFYTADETPQYHGSFNNKSYCLVGLPITMSFQTEADFDASKGLVKPNFPWDSSLGVSIKKSLILTEEEQLFLIARQFGYLDSQYVWVNFFEGLGCLALAYYAAHLTCLKLGFFTYKKHLSKITSMQGGIFFFCMLVGYALHLLLKDGYTRSLDKHADNYAGTIGIDYARAGIGYYDKQMKLNQLLRTLSITAADKTTPVGDFKRGIIRLKRQPLSSRKAYLKKLVSEFEKDATAKFISKQS